MNLLLLDPTELNSDGSVALDDRRAAHIRGVLAADVGKTLRAGVQNQGFGQATVLEIGTTRVTLRYTETTRCEPMPPRVLLLGLPRPKVLSRCLQHAAALGFTRVALMRCQRSEKGHLTSHRLDLQRMRRDCLLGLEQGGHVVVPEVSVFTRFRPFIEDSLHELASGTRFLAHPEPHRAASGSEAVDWRKVTPRYTLAIGPEGGFVAHEVECFEARDFCMLGTRAGALRVESAVSYFSGQLDALCGGT